MGRSVSPKGRKFLYSHEGVVLKAYRDAVGVLTIGAGLTSASGVVTVKPGMVITAEENDRLVDLALTRNYLPRVTKALGEGASQGAIDAGTSFDYNTGKILSASWVKSYRSGNAEDTRKRLGLWNKGGGKVLPGLTRRRAEEADILLLGRYPSNLDAPATKIGTDARFAVFVISVTPEEISAIRSGFASIGIDPGTATGKISRTAVEAFQKTYDLTVDGKIGRATLSTLQREIDARGKTKAAAAGTGASVATAGAGDAVKSAVDPATIDLTGLPDDAVLWIGGGMLAFCLAYSVYLAWSYRDMIAVRLQTAAPKIATFLRSI